MQRYWPELPLHSRLKFLNQEIEARGKKLAKLQEKRDKIRAIKEKEPKQLSKRKFEPLDLEFNLVEELNGNLRCIKPEGNILEDRYKSFQRRNVIEPTVRQRYVSYGCISIIVLLFNEVWWGSKGSRYELMAWVLCPAWPFVYESLSEICTFVT